MPRIYRKRALTLFEVLVTLSLTAIALSLLSFPLVRAWRTERFAQATESLLSQLTLAQELMLDFHADVYLRLQESEEGLLCSFELGKHLPTHVEKVARPRISIPDIQHIAWEEIPGPVSLHFDGSIGRIPYGTLTLYSPWQTETTIVLEGFPTHIKRGEHVYTQVCPTPYPEEIISAL